MSKETSSLQKSIHEAIKKDDAVTIVTLIDKGAGVDTIFDNMAPLHTAIENASFNAAKTLLEHKADPNVKNSFNSTPLHLAKTPQIVKLLLDNGADPNTKDHNGTILLHTTNDINVVKLLLDSGTDPNATEGSKKSALHHVKDAEIAKLLLDNGANPNTIDIYRQSPLHYAPSLAINDLLLKNGANPNWHDQAETTPLLRQLETDKSEDELYKIIEGLIKAGLKVNKIARKEMEKSIEICDTRGYASIKKLIANANITWRKKLLRRITGDKRGKT